MSSKYIDIIADIKTKMEEITGIGIVHDYERYSKDENKFITLFKTTVDSVDQIRGWEITRTAAPEHKRGAWFRHHRFRINGYMGIQDANTTEKTFQVLIENLSEKFRTAEPPAGATWYYMDGDNPDNSCVQVDVIDARMFGQYLCHHAEISLAVTERIA